MCPEKNFSCVKCGMLWHSIIRCTEYILASKGKTGSGDDNYNTLRNDALDKGTFLKTFSCKIKDNTYVEIWDF